MAKYATRSYSRDDDATDEPESGEGSGFDADRPALDETLSAPPTTTNTETGLQASGLVAHPNFRKVGLDQKGNVATPIVKATFRDSLNNTWNLMGDTSIEGQVVEQPTLEESLLTQSYGGWNIDNDPGDDDLQTQSYNQWAYGPAGGKSHYITNMPSGFRPILQAKDDTYKPKMLSISTPKTAHANGSSNSKDRAASAVCPTLPAGEVFEKVVVRAWCKWQGPEGTQAYAKIFLPSGLEVASEVITADKNGGIINFEYTTTDPKNVGKAFIASWHSATVQTTTNTGPDAKITPSTVHSTARIGGTYGIHDGTDTTDNLTIRFTDCPLTIKTSVNKPVIFGVIKKFSDISTTIDGGITTTLYYRHDYYQEQPVSSPGSMKSVVIGSKMGNGMLYFSTFGHLFTCNAVWAFNTKTLVDDNLKGNRLRADDYRDLINSVAVAGAAKMVYNMIMEAMNRRTKSKIVPVLPDQKTVHNREERFSTWSIVTPWRASWVIDGRNGVLNQYEISTNNFELLPKDLGANLLDYDDANFEPTLGGWKAVNNSCQLETSTTTPVNGVQCMKITSLVPTRSQEVQFSLLTPSSPSTTSGENVNRTTFGTQSITSSKFLLITVFSEQMMGATPSVSQPPIPRIVGESIKNVKTEATVRNTHSDRAKQYRLTTFSAMGTGKDAAVTIDFGQEIQVSCYWTITEVTNANAVIQTSWGANSNLNPSLAFEDAITTANGTYAVMHRYNDDNYDVGLPQQNTTVEVAIVSVASSPLVPGLSLGVSGTVHANVVQSVPVQSFCRVNVISTTAATPMATVSGQWKEIFDYTTRGANRLAAAVRQPAIAQVNWVGETVATDWAAIILELGSEEFGTAAAIAESGKFSVVPGKPYFVTASVRRGVSTFTNQIGETSTDAYDRSTRVGFRFYDSSDQLISTKYSATQVFLHENMPVYGTGVDSRGCDFITSAWWTQIGCTTKAPANAVRASASIGYYPEVSGEWQFADAVEVNCLDPDYVYQRRLSEKNYKTLIDEQIRGTDWEEKLIGLPRIYHLELTNTNVSVPRKKADELIPYAWTEVYTPKFSVPHEIGPHVVREELVVGSYSNVDYVYKTYPPKPWGAQIRVVGPNAPINTQKFSWVAKGFCTASKQNGTGPTENTLSTTIMFNWSIHINDNNSKFEFTPGVPYFGSRNQPWGIQIASELPQRQGTMGPVSLRTCWPSYGIFGVWKYGESSDVIKFVQQALNVLRTNHKLSIKPIPENGQFDAATKTAVQALIDEYGAQDHASNVTDPSTLIGPAIISVIGIQLLDLGPTRVGRTDGYFGAVFGPSGPNKFMLSDGVMTNRFMLTSSTEDVPPVITESFIFSFPKTSMFSQVFVTAGDTPNQILQSIDFIDTTRMNTNAVKDGIPPSTLSAVTPNKILAPNQKTAIKVGPYEADQIIITIRQEVDSVNRSSAFGEANIGTTVPAHKRIEIADISFEAIVPRSEWDLLSQNPNASISQGTYTYQVAIEDAGQAEISADRDLNLRAHFTPPQTTGVEYSNIVWESVTISNKDVVGSISKDGLMNFRLNSVYLAATDPSSSGDTNYVFGPILGQSCRDIVYTMDEFGRKKSLPDTGWISKNDGIQLLCKFDGSPYGFTNIVPKRPFWPTDLGKIPSARKAMKIRLERFNTDTSIVLAFYDKKQQEFITSVTGEPEISYDEYMRRGPANVYVGLVANFETQRVEEVPFNDAPKLPQRWAMPVYGMVKKNANPISLAPLSPNLSIDDVWPAAVKPGSFMRSMQVRPVSEGYLTTWLRNYQGSVVEAHYRVAESDNAGWSTIFGQPYRDIRNETPLVLGDSHIRVRQAPIHAIMEPTPRHFNQLANPVRPTFRVAIRETYDDNWRVLSLADIEDYNFSTGDIYLKTALGSLDPNLIRVDYVSTNGLVHFKQFNGTLLNLNPYPGGRNSHQVIYIYLLPEYVKDSSGQVIPHSYNADTLRFTNNPNIFDYVKPEYDPLAHQLGVIYVNTALDSNDLIVVDARRRGGGVLDTIDGDDFLNVIQESVGYWDIGHSYGEAYQKGGFVIIRLPGELRDRMTEMEIREVIDRSITAGVRYELQDLNGVDWS